MAGYNRGAMRRAQPRTKRSGGGSRLLVQRPRSLPPRKRRFEYA